MGGSCALARWIARYVPGPLGCRAGCGGKRSSRRDHV